jgi:uncharacterized protein (TIGR02678 family)
LTVSRNFPDSFMSIVRQREWLQVWFGDQPGWKLVVDAAAGFARLHKVPARLDTSRGARVAGRPAFDIRRYTLLCLVLAALDDSPVQTTLRTLSELLEELSSAEEPAISRFDPTSFAERRAFVEVLKWLSELGVLRLRDGDAERYAQTSEADALYDVDDRLLGQLLSSPVPPAFAGAPAGLLEEHLPDTDEGMRQRSRHHVFRRLLEDPVVYYDELDAAAFDWVDHSRGFVYSLLERDVGLVVERRKEGLAAVDADGELADTLFPDGGSTIKHAALLLAEQLAEIARRSSVPGDVQIPHEQVTRLVAALRSDFGDLCHWSKAFSADEQGTCELADAAIELLEGFAMVKRDSEGTRIRPAIARFRPEQPVAGAAKRSRRALKQVHNAEVP